MMTRTLEEPLGLDSFVSFHWSQYFPSHYHVLVGRTSHFFYGFTECEVRRSGRMTPGQRRRREALESKHGRPDPRAIERTVVELLQIFSPGGKPMNLTTDEHRDYPRAIARVGKLAVVHRTVSSRATRNTRNPLFAVNLLDLLIRHSSANHKRETIAFSRCRRAAIERLWLFLVWRNYVKSFSEKTRSETPAQRAGICARRWQVRQLFRRRLFPGRIPVPASWKAHFEGTIRTRVFAATSIRPLRFAY
jgi:hypothetical protein